MRRSTLNKWHEINNHRRNLPQVYITWAHLESTHAPRRHPRQGEAHADREGTPRHAKASTPNQRRTHASGLDGHFCITLASQALQFLQAAPRSRKRTFWGCLPVSSYRVLKCPKQRDVTKAMCQAPRQGACQVFVSSYISDHVPDLDQRRKYEGWRKQGVKPNPRKNKVSRRLAFNPPSFGSRPGNQQTAFRATSTEASLPSQETHD